MIWINCARTCTLTQEPCREVDDNAGLGPAACGLRLLNGPQIKQERTRVLTRETKRRHIRMANHQPFAQPLHERIKIDSAIERAKGGGASVRTLTAFTDRMALRAHPFRQRAAALLERARAAFGQSGRGCDEQKEDCEPHDHLGAPYERRKKLPLTDSA